mmetsp:Transcript_6846/g.19923  ORF Transcript_6846/g.19923 Transcript_6846/m.19923 type:complete len:330 (-) Transcript_6846:72-1061(-)
MLGGSVKWLAGVLAASTLLGRRAVRSLVAARGTEAAGSQGRTWRLDELVVEVAPLLLDGLVNPELGDGLEVARIADGADPHGLEADTADDLSGHAVLILIIRPGEGHGELLSLDETAVAPAHVLHADGVEGLEDEAARQGFREHLTGRLVLAPAHLEAVLEWRKRVGGVQNDLLLRAGAEARGERLDAGVLVRAWRGDDDHISPLARLPNRHGDGALGAVRHDLDGLVGARIARAIAHRELRPRELVAQRRADLAGADDRNLRVRPLMLYVSLACAGGGWGRGGVRLILGLGAAPGQSRVPKNMHELTPCALNARALPGTPGPTQAAVP